MQSHSLRSILFAVVLSLQCVAFQASAHGEAEPRFGGIVKAAQDISFELVANAPGGAQVWLDDHGELMPTTGITGKLTIVNPSGRKETALHSDGEKLTAPDAIPVSGDRAILVVVLPSGQTISVRYAIE